MRTYHLDGIRDGVNAVIESVCRDGDVEILRFAVTSDEETVPKPLKLWWEEDMVNHLFVWHPGGGNRHNMYQSWRPTTNTSRFCCGAPMMTLIGDHGINRETVAVSDVCTPIAIRFFVDDFPQKYKVNYSVTFFEGQCDPMRNYEAYIRIDTRAIAYEDAVRSVYPWWMEFGYEIPPIPTAAEDPLYSTWYNFHQMPKAGAILADLKLASELGFRTVILDDGWQFEGEPSGCCYSRVGDWEVAKDKFPDFRAFSDSVHALGMKLIVWFSVPFVGKRSRAFERFLGKYLYTDGGDAGVLDPRYPEVRSYLTDTYSRFLKEYDIDGFKLDFIDSFRPGDLTKPFGEGMDHVTVDSAVKTLLDEITARLAEIKPDLLYEYRQGYVGPAINRYGNMLRVADCAYDAHINHYKAAELRLLGYPTAIHSDMLYWAREESVLLCARQLLNVLFSVPQISVILANSTEEQKKLICAFLNYWTEHREIILHGKFRAPHPELSYPILSAENDTRRIVTVNADLPYRYDGKACDVFNNSSEDGLIIENPTNEELHAEILNCFGETVGDTLIGAKAVARVNVPAAGRVSMRMTH